MDAWTLSLIMNTAMFFQASSEKNLKSLEEFVSCRVKSMIPLIPLQVHLGPFSTAVGPWLWKRSLMLLTCLSSQYEHLVPYVELRMSI